MFGGNTYDPALDRERLRRQLGRVYETMRSGDWMTLADITQACRAMGYPDTEAAVSARVRDLRKPEFGFYEVESKRKTGGLWHYRLLARQTEPQMSLPI